MPDPLYGFMLEAYDGSIKRFLQDMEPLSHDDLNNCYGSSCRKAYDFIYEVAFLHRRFAKELLGEDMGPFPFKPGETWLPTPPEMCDKNNAVEYFKTTAKELRDAFEAKKDEPMSDGSGPTQLFKTMRFGNVHCGYHDAQLNFIQAMKGDMAVHW